MRARLHDNNTWILSIIALMCVLSMSNPRWWKAAASYSFSPCNSVPLACRCAWDDGRAGSWETALSVIFCSTNQEKDRKSPLWRWNEPVNKGLFCRQKPVWHFRTWNFKDRITWGKPGWEQLLQSFPDLSWWVLHEMHVSCARSRPLPPLLHRYDVTVSVTHSGQNWLYIRVTFTSSCDSGAAPVHTHSSPNQRIIAPPSEAQPPL